MSEADVINESCQQAAWPGGVSFYPTINTFTKLKAQLDAWALFRVVDLGGIATGLSILPATTFNNGVLTLHYSVNGKDGLCYGWARNYGMTGDGPCSTVNFGATGKCSLILPGSGLNQAAAIIANTGYQNVLYNPVCTIGDGIVHVLPGMDFRLLQGTNGLGYLRQAIDNYLIDHGSSLAIVEVVEACAILKWIQTANTINAAWPAYTKAAALGLSKGAFQSLLVGFLMSPTAAVCASGVSLASPMQGYGLAGGNIGLSAFDENSIINGVAGSATKFLFSKSAVSELALLIYENAYGYTENALGFPNVTHVTHSAGHKYPPSLGAFLVAALT